MFSKLALKNVTKSMKDYSVYFLTLMFGVCLFYTFNSIDSQTAMLRINESQQRAMKSLAEVIGYVSVFISVVLGFLIVYANGFLMKRRKKELGVYMTLGMSKSKISIIIILETLLIGLFSLAVGLVLGIFLSQGMSLVTAKLFGVTLTKFAFTFSAGAFWKTLIYFGVMFLVIMLFNTVSVSKLKLIDLLSAAHKNQKFHIRRLWVSVVIFLVSVGCIAAAYYLVETYGIFNLAPQFVACLILGIVGTLLFFLSLSGFLLRITQSNKRLYFKGLNMFVLRQFNSKINTTFVSVSVICIMLLITIGSLSTGLNASQYLSRELEAITPFDASLELLNSKENAESGENKNLGIAERLNAAGFDIDKWAESYVEIHYYELKDIPYQSLIAKSDIPDVYVNYFDSVIKDIPMTAMSLSDFNQLLKINGKEKLTLKENEYAINCTYDGLLTGTQNAAAAGRKITLNGTQLSPLSTTLSEMEYDQGMSSEFATLILPDSYLKGMNLQNIVLNIQFKPGTDNSKFVTALTNVQKNGNDSCFDGFVTKADIYDNFSGSKAASTYLTLYIGLVFLIAAAAVLALQQLSESSDNAERYGLLRKLGTEEKMINRALFTQVALYFLLPLSLAIVHSVVGIDAVNQALINLNNMDILGSIIGTACFLVVIYGAYFLATYFGCKSMIRQKEISRRVD
jgi:putative ABC transport system permease protein